MPGSLAVASQFSICLGSRPVLFSDFTSKKGDEAERVHVIFSDNCIKKDIRKPFNHKNSVTVWRNCSLSVTGDL